ncbi:MAG: glycosyltransferase family 4 protein [Ferruginibacter sp.]|nr:glycosyltransferase family 4 protein [Ferruginibacter sp.]
MKKILFHSHSNSIGGAELSLLETIKFMKNQGHRIYLTLPHSSRTDYFNLVQPYCEAIILVKPMKFYSSAAQKNTLLGSVRNYFYSAYKSGWHILPVVKIYLFLKRHKIDIVHSNTCFSIDGALAAKLARKPHILHIREITGNGVGSTLKLYFQGTAFFKNLMSLLCTKIICNSHYTFNASKIDFPESKMIVLYNPIKEQTHSTSERVSATKVFGCVANLTARWKNHELAIRLLKNLQDQNPDKQLQLVFFGSLPVQTDDYLLSLKNLIKQLGVEDHVKFKGSIPQDSIYSQIDFLIHPAPFEPFGRVIIEAMVNRVPVIGINAGGAGELITDGITGLLISPEISQSEIEKVSYVINNKEVRNQMVSSALAFSRNFKPEIILTQLEQIYLSLNSSNLAH